MKLFFSKKWYFNFIQKYSIYDIAMKLNSIVEKGVCSEHCLKMLKLSYQPVVNQSLIDFLLSTMNREKLIQSYFQSFGVTRTVRQIFSQFFPNCFIFVLNVGISSLYFNRAQLCTSISMVKQISNKRLS